MKGLVRWRLALQALVAFVVFGALKYAVCTAGLEILGPPNTLFSSVIGGAIFVFQGDLGQCALIGHFTN